MKQYIFYGGSSTILQIEATFWFRTRGKRKKTKKMQNARLFSQFLLGKIEDVLACSISENLGSMSSGMDQLKIPRFSFIGDSVLVFGTTLWPICTPQRRTTCAGVFANFSATIKVTGCSRTFFLTCSPDWVPNGEYPYNNKNEKSCSYRVHISIDTVQGRV